MKCIFLNDNANILNLLHTKPLAESKKVSSRARKKHASTNKT